MKSFSSIAQLIKRTFSTREVGIVNATAANSVATVEW
jgi:hypothetical protein